MAAMGRGDYPTAMSLLEQAQGESHSSVTQVLCDPVFDPLRHEERYLRLTKRLGVGLCR